MADGYAFSALHNIESMSTSLQDPANFHLTSPAHERGLQYCMSNHVNIDAAARLHVVMVPYPAQGQINPMMQFAKLLTAAKHGDIMVTFVNNKYNHDRIQRSTPKEGEADSKLRLAWVDNGLPSDFNYSDISGSRFKDFHLSTVHMKEPLKQLLHSLNHRQCNVNTPPVSCVLFGSFCPWAQSAAAELGIPSLLFWTQSASQFSIYYHMPLLVANGFFPYNKKSLAGCNIEDDVSDLSVTYSIPGLPPLLPSSFPTLLHVDDFSDHSLATVKEQFSLVGNCHGVIINSFEELEKDACQVLQQQLPYSISLVGPLLPSAFLDGNGTSEKTINGATSVLQEKNACIEWLDGKHKQSVLYISFGTLFTPSATELQAIALGIRSSKQPYLWVIRPNSSSADVSNILPKSFLQDTKDYGLIVPWAPQVQVLSHPSAGAFLTHCGWNSTLESLSMGVPMISFPIFLDQPTNSTYVCDIWKVGMALKRQHNGEVNSEDVEKVLRIVLQEEEGLHMRERAGKLRDAARRATQAQGSSYSHIEKLIQALRNHAKPCTPTFHDPAKEKLIQGLTRPTSHIC